MTFERYEEAARRTVFYARLLAMHRGLSEIKPVDIILGAALECRRNSSLFPLFADQWLVLNELLGGPKDDAACPVERNLPLSKNSKRALAYAAQEADNDKRWGIRLDHLVRGVVLSEDEVGSVLRDAGYTLPVLRQASAEINRVRPDMIGSRRRRLFRFAKRAYIWRLIVVFVAALFYLRWQN